MSNSATPRRDDYTAAAPSTSAPSASDARAERRGLIKAIDALRRRLDNRPGFEAADQRRLDREGKELERAEEVRAKALHRLRERQARLEASLTQESSRLEDNRAYLEEDDHANLRRRLQRGMAESLRIAEAACAEFAQFHADALERLTADHREAADHAAERRAEFDAMAAQLLDLQVQLSVHIDQYGDLGRRVRRTQTRALRPVPRQGPK